MMGEDPHTDIIHFKEYICMHVCECRERVSLFNFLKMLNDPLVHSNGGHVEARQHLLRLSNINNYNINGNSVNNNNIS